MSQTFQPMSGSGSTPKSSDASFAPTRWTIVLAAAHGTLSPQAAIAMGELCQAYWHPLYAYIRRRGHDMHEAEDLTQEFFLRLLSKNSLADLDRRKGKFRAFLLASLKNFLANQWDRSQAIKRGGGQFFTSLDTTIAENRYRQQPVDDLTPERIFERHWALAVLDRVLARLQAEFSDNDKRSEFEMLKPFLTASQPQTRYADVAVKLQTTEGAVKVAVHRLRHRYRELLRAEIAQTVASPEEIDDEIRHLLASLS